MHNKTPKDGLAGLKENWKSDALSGFLVFILALPLSMGIAQASEFSPIYGLITAMIGGVVVSFMAGSPLTIKGPAAGLIVIVAGAVTEFGGGDLGWKLTLGAVIVAGVVQIVFGLMKLGKMSDFFPLSAVHGMLAAIGIIIMSKQVHGLLGQNPKTPEGKSMVEPLELIGHIPHSIANLNQGALFIGLVSLVIIFGWPLIKNKSIRRFPAAFVVLLVTIPLAKFSGLDSSLYVHFDKDLSHVLAIDVSFDGMAQTGTFIKYVIMFALVGSLEALLTVKAIDMLDPYKRKSNYNKDLIAVGVGNMLAGVVGGLPMISEVARSSANVANGGKTRWANFFHGLFIMIFLILDLLFSDLIPKPALAALLIGVGWRLAHPREFSHMWIIGKEQLIIFVGTILATIATDLLVGIAVGILIKMGFEISKGVKLNEMFKAKLDIKNNGDEIYIKVHSSLVFSNYISLNNVLQQLPKGGNVKFDVTACKLVDHSTLENLHHFDNDYHREGGKFEFVGLAGMTPLSDHNQAVHIRK